MCKTYYCGSCDNTEILKMHPDCCSHCGGSLSVADFGEDDAPAISVCSAQKIKAIEEQLAEKNWKSSLVLLRNAIEKAKAEPVFNKHFNNMFENYSTISARYDIFSHFGTYMNDLNHANAVDGIDAAFAHIS